MHLVKTDNNLVIDQKELEKSIIESVSKGECTTPEDISNKFGITHNQVINLFSNPNFTDMIAKTVKAKLKLNFYTKGVNKIQQLVESDDPKIALQAIKLEAQLTQDLKGVNVTDVNINVSLEGLVKEAEKDVTFWDTEYKRVNDTK